MGEKHSIEIPFAIGEEVWCARPGGQEDRVTCPDCAGNLKHVLTAGNGESVELECRSCALSFESPRGWIMRRVPGWYPERFTCRRIVGWGNEMRYSDSLPDATVYSCMDVDHLFRDRADCDAFCTKMTEQQREHMEEQSIRHLASKRKDLAWSYTYWTRQIKSTERDLERIRARLVKCKKPTRKAKAVNDV